MPFSTGYPQITHIDSLARRRLDNLFTDESPALYPHTTLLLFPASTQPVPHPGDDAPVPSVSPEKGEPSRTRGRLQRTRPGDQLPQNRAVVPVVLVAHEYLTEHISG